MLVRLAVNQERRFGEVCETGSGARGIGSEGEHVVCYFRHECVSVVPEEVVHACRRVEKVCRVNRLAGPNGIVARAHGFWLGGE